MLPEEQQEPNGDVDLSEEDAAERDRRNQALREAAEAAELSRRTQVLQRNLPRPLVLDVNALIERVEGESNAAEAAITEEMALLIVNDAFKYPLSNAKIQGTLRPLATIDDESLNRARQAIATEIEPSDLSSFQKEFNQSCDEIYSASSAIPGLEVYEPDGQKSQHARTEAFYLVQQSSLSTAEKSHKVEKKLDLHYGGYQQRAKTLRQKIVQAAEALEKECINLDAFRTLQISEEAALPARLEKLRDEVAFVKKRERELQETYRAKRDELEDL